MSSPGKGALEEKSNYKSIGFDNQLGRSMPARSLGRGARRTKLRDQEGQPPTTAANLRTNRISVPLTAPSIRYDKLPKAVRSR